MLRALIIIIIVVFSQTVVQLREDLNEDEIFIPKTVLTQELRPIIDFIYILFLFAKNVKILIYFVIIIAHSINWREFININARRR